MQTNHNQSMLRCFKPDSLSVNKWSSCWIQQRYQRLWVGGRHPMRTRLNSTKLNSKLKSSPLLKSSIFDAGISLNWSMNIGLTCRHRHGGKNGQLNSKLARGKVFQLFLVRQRPKNPRNGFSTIWILLWHKLWMHSPTLGTEGPTTKQNIPPDKYNSSLPTFSTSHIHCKRWYTRISNPVRQN